MIYPDAERGVILSARSLVLQGVERSDAGDYVCAAVNAEGAGKSNPVPLKIMCE